MSAERNIERLVDDIRSIIKHGEALVHNMPKEVNDRVKDTRERFSKALDSARSTCRNLEDKTVERIQAADEAIHEKPYPFMGASLAVGLLLGILMCKK